MVEPTLLLFLGNDEPEKQKRLELLKAKLFPASLKDLNTTVIYANDSALSPSDLTEALTSTPTGGASKRLVIIKMAHKLSKALAGCLQNIKDASLTSTVMVLDIPEPKGLEEFVASLKKRGAQVVIFKSEIAVNVFDLGRAIFNRQPAAALKILSGIMPGRERPEKIIGGLLWQWERFRTERRLSDEIYARGIKVLCEADKRLKTSSAAHRQERLILETLVVKLSCLA